MWPSSRRFGAVVGACLAFVLLVGACGNGEAPRYENAAAIGDALQAHGIVCAYSPISAGDALGAESAGQCKGSDFVALMYVYATKADSQRQESAARDYWCRRGTTSGSFVSADRWLATLDAPPTNDPNAVYMSDIARATGGRRVPQHCG